MAAVTFTCYIVPHDAAQGGNLQDRFDFDLLDDDDPFEIDRQLAHLFKHVDAELLYDIWWADPVFFEARPPAHWLMLAPVAGELYVAALAPSANGDPTKCRPIGLQKARDALVRAYHAGGGTPRQ